MPKLEKGSQSAKERMAHLRSLRKKKGTGTSPAAVEPLVSQSAVADPESPKTGKGGKKSPWIKWVADYAHKNNVNYFTALQNPDVKKSYHSQK